MNKIYIHKNPNGDTRTAPIGVTFEQFHEANIAHMHDVNLVMYFLSKRLVMQGVAHDHTKLEYEQEVYENFCDAMNKGTDFRKNTWYQKHITEEKHHPFSKCHDDITLFDIIETIVDCICAGKARSGEVFPIKFDPSILELAAKNTVKLVDDMVEAV